MNDEQGIDTTRVGGFPQFDAYVEITGTRCICCHEKLVFLWRGKTSKICITCLGRAIQELIDQVPDEDDEMENKPEFVTDEHLEYLDDLRESGVVNMYGAEPYLLAEFPGLDDEQAEQVLLYWMHTFSDRHPRKEK